MYTSYSAPSDLRQPGHALKVYESLPHRHDPDPELDGWTFRLCIYETRDGWDVWQTDIDPQGEILQSTPCSHWGRFDLAVMACH